MTTSTLEEHLFGPGPKRILALDGGGIRGLISLQVLRSIETMLRRRCGDSADFRLCDYFDLIGGTSTGAIIASALAIGMSVDEIERFYLQLGKDIFKDELFRLGLLRAKYKPGPLREALDKVFANRTIGDNSIRTGLAIVLKRLDSRSPWVIHNNPRGKHFEKHSGRLGVPNKDLLLRQVVRASTAAPHYFDPEPITVGTESSGKTIEGLFVDGGVSPHNNPALQLVMMAWMSGYEYRWPTGRDKLLLVSIGTGSSKPTETADELADKPEVVRAAQSLSSLMDDAAELNETMLQWMSASATARSINREILDLSGDIIGGGLPLLTYVRYNARLDSGWLNDHGLDLKEEEIEAVRAMDDPTNMALLTRIGVAAAGQVSPEHFAASFDVPIS